METENKDWKPEVGGKAWIVFGENVYEAIVSRKNESSYEQWYMSNSTDQKKHGFGWIDTRDVFPTAEAAYNSFVSGIKIYDLEGKEVLIPRADAFLAEKVLGLQMENDLLKKPVTTLAQAQMLLYQHGMILGLSGLSPILIERGGAAIGGKSEPKQIQPCHVCQLTKYERRGKPCTEITCPNQFIDRGGKSDQREGGC